MSTVLRLDSALPQLTLTKIISGQEKYGPVKDQFKALDIILDVFAASSPRVECVNNPEPLRCFQFLKTLWEKEKMLVTTIFFFFKKCFLPSPNRPKLPFMECSTVTLENTPTK